MTIAFVLFLIVHGAIHLLGVVKAFGWAPLSALTVPISRAAGVGWLVACVLFVTAAALVLTRPRAWWIVAALAVAVSTMVIAPSWHDAKFGMAANAVALVGVAFGVLAFGPTSLRAAYDRDVALALSGITHGPPVRDQDLASLPAPVQRYLRAAGVVGRPRPTSVFVRLHGRIRSSPEARWMPFRAEQYDVVGPEASRLFYMTATRAGLPLQGYHRFVADDASMTIKAAALLPVIDMRGAVMAQSETVTLFNDMCVMAPATLLDERVQWQGVQRDRRAGVDIVTGRFTHRGRSIAARLFIDADGHLIDFDSNDRAATSADGTSVRRLRWSTPLRAPRQFGDVRLMSYGEGRWHEDGGSWAYIELTVDEVVYDVAPRRQGRHAAQSEQGG
jgi:hypothetical protein